MWLSSNYSTFSISLGVIAISYNVFCLNSSNYQHSLGETEVFPKSFHRYNTRGRSSGSAWTIHEIILPSNIVSFENLDIVICDCLTVIIGRIPRNYYIYTLDCCNSSAWHLWLFGSSKSEQW